MQDAQFYVGKVLFNYGFAYVSLILATIVVLHSYPLLAVLTLDVKHINKPMNL